ncbi:HERV-H LTR-associating protein 2 [Liparis tanakae]|uniref:HERV-H LTR-associating protein 2 n=1 Tax=Liparis tanakae TaxID=230148 RepID=A0A4Z2E1B4_9TELE|nr:HERV-H LTR-associating protein 2 [Liparis tanakae]
MESCILPCYFQTGGVVVLHWHAVQGNIPVHIFYNNQDQLKDQSERFRNRTSLFKDQIPKGNASLLLKGVKLQDEGRYKCYISNKTWEESFINLKVDAPVRKVDMQQLEDRITCSSQGVYPEPTLTWTTEPPSNETLQNRTSVQRPEQQLYSISSSLDPDPGLDYSCTVSTARSNRTATWFRPSRCF